MTGRHAELVNHIRGSQPLVPLTIVVVLATLLLVASGGQSAAPRIGGAQTARWQGLVEDRRPRAAIGQRMLIVLDRPSLADRVARAGGQVSDAEQRKMRARVVASQRLLLAGLALEGVEVIPEFTYTRVLNGFSAPLDARALALVERRRDVAGVYPVRATYPAAMSTKALRASSLFAPGMGHRPDVALPGFDGRGVTIALLDTGLDASQPFLVGRVEKGVNVVDVAGSPAAANRQPVRDARARGVGAAQAEIHGTQLAGILVGTNGPLGLAGVAPGASVIPIRVAGWQREATGGWAVYGRTDQLLAGLERAVDPNDDGVTHDAARIALVGVAEPFAAFGDGPVARAVAGATKLDTLVVAAAGNDGPAGPAFGSIAGPGGAPEALTVGAADVRRETDEARLVLRTGLRVELDAIVPLAGSVVPERALDLAVAMPARPSARAAASPGAIAVAGESLADFFDAGGFSRVAGRAALVAPGRRPKVVVRNAARAGAAAVLLDTHPPPGPLGLDQTVPVPVASIGAASAAKLRGAARRRVPVSVLLGAPGTSPNPAVRRVAGFSSRGLAFDGRIKPEVAAPGVAVATAEPGANEDGSPQFATINGSSAAAACVAGAAALLAQARPGLDARALKSLLVGSARPLPHDSVAAQGAGLLDVGAAATAEVMTQPTALSFGQGRRISRALVIRNVSTRALSLSFRTEGAEGLTNALFAFAPAKIRLRSGAAARVRISVRRGRVPPATRPLWGWIRIVSGGGAEVGVPWVLAGDHAPLDLLGEVALSAKEFRVSDTAPAVLAFRAGRVLRVAGRDQVRPVARLEVELWAGKRKVGVLARLRDLLPGRYAFGLTGRGPRGGPLRAGTYRLRLLAVPAGPGAWSDESVRFRIK